MEQALLLLGRATGLLLKSSQIKAATDLFPVAELIKDVLDGLKK